MNNGISISGVKAVLFYEKQHAKQNGSKKKKKHETPQDPKGEMITITHNPQPTTDLPR
jgi:hypothetical protein